MNKRLFFGRAGRDLLAIALGIAIVLVLSYFFDVFIFIIKFIEKHPRAITYIDEVITGLLALSIGLAIFSFRRWQELKKETAERIRLQDELIKIANIKAETERIISKQLRSEIELRKQ